MNAHFEPPISDLMLEKYQLKELNDVDTLRLSQCHLQDRLNALSASNERILAEYPPDLLKKQIERRMNVSRWNFEFPQVLTSRHFRHRVAFALVLLVLPVGLFLVPGHPTGDRVKGMTPFINVYKKSGDSFEKLGADVFVKERDILQLSYVAADAKFGAIFSMDGAGKLTLHYPELPGAAAPLVPSGEVILPDAFELDNGPQFEQFVFVTSKELFRTSDVMQSFQAMQGSTPLSLNLSANLKLFYLLLRK